jgi:hypothetical protein
VEERRFRLKDLQLGIRRPRRRRTLAEMRQNVHQLRPPLGCFSPETRRGRRESSGQRLREREKWHGGVLLEAAADEFLHSSGCCTRENLLDEPSFADPGSPATRKKRPLPAIVGSSADRIRPSSAPLG